MASTRAFSVFVDVEAFVDGKRDRGHDTFMRIVDDATTFKELLEQCFILLSSSCNHECRYGVR